MDLNNAIELKRKLEALCEDRGFLFLNTQMQEQVDDLQQSILFSPCNSLDSAIAHEYKKGQLEGRLAWKNLLDGLLTNLTIEIDNLRSDDEDDTRDIIP